MALRFAACIVCVWRIRLFVARHARAPRTRTRRGPRSSSTQKKLRRAVHSCETDAKKPQGCRHKCAPTMNDTRLVLQ